VQKAISIFIISFFLFKNLVGQKFNAPIFKPKGVSFSDYVRQHLDLDSLSLCEESISLVRFKIDQKGNVSDFAFSKGVNPVIKKDLHDAVFSSSGKWNPCKVNNHAVKSGYLILYVFISIGTGCNQQVIDNYFNSIDSSTLKPLKDIARFGDSIVNKERNLGEKYSHTLSEYLNQKSVLSMKNIFVFDDDKYETPLNYYLLGTIYFTDIY
jgi:hypothetical protein